MRSSFARVRHCARIGRQHTSKPVRKTTPKSSTLRSSHAWPLVLGSYHGSSPHMTAKPGLRRRQKISWDWISIIEHRYISLLSKVMAPSCRFFWIKESTSILKRLVCVRHRCIWQLEMVIRLFIRYYSTMRPGLTRATILIQHR